MRGIDMRGIERTFGVSRRTLSAWLIVLEGEDLCSFHTRACRFRATYREWPSRARYADHNVNMALEPVYDLCVKVILTQRY